MAAERVTSRQVAGKLYKLAGILRGVQSACEALDLPEKAAEMRSEACEVDELASRLWSAKSELLAEEA